jgi:hypothetical protein
MIPRNRWPESLMAFLADHSTVTVEDIAYGALRSPWRVIARRASDRTSVTKFQRSGRN